MESSLLNHIRRVSLWAGIVSILLAAILAILAVWGTIDLVKVSGILGFSITNWGKAFATVATVAHVAFSVLLTLLVAGHIKTVEDAR